MLELIKNLGGEKEKMDKKTKNSVLGILFVVLAISTTSATPMLHFVPQDSSVVGYCNGTVVDVRLSLSEGDTLIDFGQFGISYNPLCGNITDRNLNTDILTGVDPSWASWNSPPLGLGSEKPCWGYGMDWIIFDFWIPKTGPSDELIGNFTIHCNSTNLPCTNYLNFTCMQGCSQGCIYIWDSSDNELAYSVVNGTFLCGEAGDPGIADHVVISEVQIGGATAKDEFVELYNPTNAQVSLEGWYLTKKTSGGTEGNLLAGFPDTSIPAHGFFLITPQSNYTGSVTADATYSQTTNSIAADNTVILYSDNKITVVDKVGFGDAADNETLSYPDNPGDNKSLQRMINATIKEGGYGPAWDTNNNSADFFTQAEPSPQNLEFGPVAPIPELDTLVLLMTGMVALVGYVIVKKGRKG